MEWSQKGQYIASEAARVLKPGSNAIFYPSLPRIEGVMKLIFAHEGVTVTHEPTPRDTSVEYAKWVVNCSEEEIMSAFFSRTRLCKARE